MRRQKRKQIEEDLVRGVEAAQGFRLRDRVDSKVDAQETSHAQLHPHVIENVAASAI